MSSLDDSLLQVGRRILAFRKAKELTQEGLAEAAGIDASYVARIEGGTRTPKLETLLAIATALGVALGDLFAGTGRDADEEQHHAIAGLVEVVRGLSVADLEALAVIARRFPPAEAASAASQRPTPYGKKKTKTKTKKK